MYKDEGWYRNGKGQLNEDIPKINYHLQGGNRKWILLFTQISVLAKTPADILIY